MINQNGISLLELYDGENTNLINDNLTNFSFSKYEFNLTSFAPEIILVKKKSQKAIIIGKAGQKIKHIGTDTRLEMEKFLKKRFFLI